MAAPRRWTQAIAAVQGEHVEAISLTTPETDLASLQALGTVTSADDPAGVSAAFARVADLLTAGGGAHHDARRRRAHRRPTRRTDHDRRADHHDRGPDHDSRSADDGVLASAGSARGEHGIGRQLRFVSLAVAGCRGHLRRPVRGRAPAVPPAAGFEGPAGHPQAAQRVRHGQAHDVGRRGGPRAARQASRSRHRAVGRRHLRATRRSSSPWWRSSPSWPASSACWSAAR